MVGAVAETAAVVYMDPRALPRWTPSAHDGRVGMGCSEGRPACRAGTHFQLPGAAPAAPECGDRGSREADDALVTWTPPSANYAVASVRTPVGSKSCKTLTTPW